MKRIVIIILFLSVTTGITLINVNVRKDSTGMDLKMKNIEALGSGEGGGSNPCNAPGTLCMTYDENHDPVFWPGLSIGDIVP